MDFVKCLGNDMVVNIFKCLDPADVVRACLISPDWRDFIIGNEVAKQLCLRQFPRVVADIVDVRVTLHENKQIRSLISLIVEMIWGASQKKERTDAGSEGELILSRNHKVYASLLHALQKLIKSDPIDCKDSKISVSDYPRKGLKDPAIPETLIFKLKHDQCVITEIDIRPYREYLTGIQLEKEECSTKSVRFRMGFPKSATKKVIDTLPNYRGYFDIPLLPIGPDGFTWTYTSPEFPINRVCQPLALGRRGQQFKLPEPVLCIGGIVMMELLGRVQMDEQKGPYYIKIGGVNVLGRSLSPAFKAEAQGQSGKLVLSYDASRLSDTLERPPEDEITDPRRQNFTVCACACSNSIEM